MAASSKTRFYPAADLIAWLGCETNAMTAELCGVHPGALNGWKARKTRFTEAEATRYADHLRVHPCEIWGELWWEHAPSYA